MFCRNTSGVRFWSHKLDEVRGLQRAVVEQHAVVGEDADLVAPDAREAADQRRAVVRLVFVEAAAVDDARDDLAHVEAGLDVVGDDAVELCRVVVRRPRARAVDALSSPPACDCATISRAMAIACVLVVGRVVAGAARCWCACRRRRAPRRVDHLAGGRLHQRRPAEEDAAVAAHDDAVVGQRRDVGAAGGAMAEHHGDLRHAQLGQHALVAEDAPAVVAVGEELGLQRQEAAGAVAQVDRPAAGSRSRCRACARSS